MKIARYVGGAIVLAIIAVGEWVYTWRFRTRERKKQHERINTLWDAWMRSVGGTKEEQERVKQALTRAQCEYARGKNWKGE